VSAQVPVNIQIQIVKAEDARRYDKVLEDLLRSPVPAIRERAELAAGRIGDDRAIPALVVLLNNGGSSGAMAAFALGEIESIKAADAILRAITSSEGQTRARLVEAAGKIAAGNPKDEKSKALGTAVLNVLDAELKKPSAPDTAVIRLALTAVLRARPAGAEDVIRPVLAFTDPNIVADALNTLARLKAKGANRDARDLLETNLNAIVRANAARVLGAAEDKSAVDILTKAAVGDADSRVRISAIRSLATLKVASAAEALLDRGERLLKDSETSKFRNPIQLNEELEIASAIGLLRSGSLDSRGTAYEMAFAWFPRVTPEGEIGLARISPSEITKASRMDPSIKILWEGASWFHGRDLASIAQGLGEIANSNDENARANATESLAYLLNRIENEKRLDRYRTEVARAIPDIIRSYAAFKPPDIEKVLEKYLKHPDTFVRATAAELLGEQKPTKESVEVLKSSFSKALVTDKYYDDAQLAIMEALFRSEKNASTDILFLALNAPDYLVRKKAFELLGEDQFQQNPGVSAKLESARSKNKDQVLPFSPATGTKLGQLLNTDADYRRALSRRNGAVKATVNTEKGSFTIDLLPEDAPLTVDNFVKLARSGYYNGLEVHRVVPNFVMQDGDPRGDGNGGPGWSIRCEINMVPYERGAVGMALSGKDTGGSQWFVTHSPQPHLDGGYTVFGKVNDAGMKVVDNIVRGDKILSVNIVEGAATRRRAKRR
jgi:cyclophilin family peptidyl-prolyl cis-trans isomerase/HEAT repeat protein